MNKTSTVQVPQGTIGQNYITPESSEWHTFVMASSNYISHYWPEALESKTINQFAAGYEVELKKRILQGGRILLLWTLNRELLGFANAWVEGRMSLRTLNIAEFHVLPTAQKKGLGKSLFQLLCDEGRRHGARNIRAEVDKHMQANGFWKHMGLTLDPSSEDRNIFTGKLEPIRIIFMRHGKIVIPQRAYEVCIDQNKLTLQDDNALMLEKLAGNFNLDHIPVSTSPYARTKQTATALFSKASFSSLQDNDGLVEFFPEELFGKTWEEISKEYVGDIEELTLYGDRDTLFQNSEKTSTAKNRIEQACLDLVHTASLRPLRMAVSHQGIHALLILKILGGSESKRHAIQLNYLCATVLQYNGERQEFELEVLNQPIENILQHLSVRN
ncbi:MAG: GNAT family N-acetyltransferase [Oligoflexia bacterium]|nr:GNAT family N-acetyltransferase [Oligoflexia bacterium]